MMGQALSAAQQRFCSEWLEPARESGAEIPEITSCAAWSAEALNAFLRAYGFTMQLGEQASRRRDSRRYPAARLVRGVSFHRATGFPKPVAAIQVANGDTAYLSVLDREPSRLGSAASPALADPASESGAFDLVALALSIERALGPSTDEFGSLVFLKVALDVTVALQWLAGLRTETVRGEPAEVGQALQETKLRMNERGRAWRARPPRGSGRPWYGWRRRTW